MSITIEQARDAKQGIRAQLGDALPVVGVGLTKLGPDFAVKVNLERAPDGVVLPTRLDGVPLVYEVVGRISPRL